MKALQTLIILLANGVWQICLVAGVGYACCILFRRASGWTKHSIWILAILLGALLPFASLASARKHPFSHSARVRQVVLLSQTFEQAVWFDASYLDSSVRPRKPLLSAHPALSFIAVLYGLFLTCWMVRLGLGWKSIRYTLSKVDPNGISEHVNAIACDCGRSLSVRPVRLVCSLAATIPFTSGVFKPVIVLPSSLLKMSEEDLRTAISHELAHIARNDYLLNLLCEIASLPFAFHPCVAWMKQQAAKAREMACDALAATCFENSTVYARSLVSLARELPQVSLLSAPGSALGVFDGNALEERVMHLLDRRHRSARGVTIALSVTLLFFTGACVAGYSFAFQSGPTSASPVSSAVGADGKSDRTVAVRNLTLLPTDELSGSEQQFVTSEIKSRTYKSTNLDVIAERIRFAFQQRGYFKVIVRDPIFTVVSRSTDPEIIDVSAKIDKGQIYKLKVINFIDEKLFNQAELRKLFPIADGDTLDRVKIVQGLEGLRNLYVSNGYTKFSAVPETQIDESAHTVSISIHIDEGIRDASSNH